MCNRILWMLGEAYEGIIFFRKMFIQLLEIVRAGGRPTINFFRDSEANRGLEPPRIPLEPSRFGGRTTYVPQEAGYRADGDKINEVMKTWETMDRSVVEAFR